MNNENIPPAGANPSSGKRPLEDALQLGPRKKPSTADPLVHHGRHFGRTVHALSNLYALINNGILRMARSEDPDEAFTQREQQEHKVFLSLLLIVPGLEDRLLGGESDQDDIHSISTLLQKGASSARSDDTKSLKSAILDWLVPPGEALIPPIHRNSKIQRGFNHEKTGALLCPAGVDWKNLEIRQKLRNHELSVSGDQWPIFLYSLCKYDDNDPWNGLLQGEILVKTFKHIFTSPSSVDIEGKATWSGNARIHGMTHTTPASIAYAAMQARFALSSKGVFTRADTDLDSERFYNSILALLQDVDEKKEVDNLLGWWNRQVFPNYAASPQPVSKNSALARIKAKRAEAKKAILLDSTANI